MFLVDIHGETQTDTVNICVVEHQHTAGTKASNAVFAFSSQVHPGYGFLSENKEFAKRLVNKMFISFTNFHPELIYFHSRHICCRFLQPFTHHVFSFINLINLYSCVNNEVMEFILNF